MAGTTRSGTDLRNLWLDRKQAPPSELCLDFTWCRSNWQEQDVRLLFNRNRDPKSLESYNADRRHFVAHVGWGISRPTKDTVLRSLGGGGFVMLFLLVLSLHEQTMKSVDNELERWFVGGTRT